MEGPSLTSFNADAAIKLWWKDCCTSRRVNQNPRKEHRPGVTNSSELESEGTSMEGTDTSTLTLSAWDDWFDSDTDTSVNDD